MLDKNGKQLWVSGHTETEAHRKACHILDVPSDNVKLVQGEHETCVYSNRLGYHSVFC